MRSFGFFAYLFCFWWLGTWSMASDISTEQTEEGDLGEKEEPPTENETDILAYVSSHEASDSEDEQSSLEERPLVTLIAEAPDCATMMNTMVFVTTGILQGVTGGLSLARMLAQTCSPTQGTIQATLSALLALNALVGAVNAYRGKFACGKIVVSPRFCRNDERMNPFFQLICCKSPEDVVAKILPAIIYTIAFFGNAALVQVSTGSLCDKDVIIIPLVLASAIFIPYVLVTYGLGRSYYSAYHKDPNH